MARNNDIVSLIEHIQPNHRRKTPRGGPVETETKRSGKKKERGEETQGIHFKQKTKKK